MSLKVIVLVKAVKWHQNTAAAKLNLKLCAYFKGTDSTLCKKQNSSPYHGMLSFYLKVGWNCLMKIFCLRGKKLGFSNKNIMVSLGNLERHQECPAVQPPTPSDAFNSSRWPLLQDDLPSILLLWPLGHKLSIGCCCHSVRLCCTLSSKE